MRHSKNYNSLPYNKNLSHRARTLRKAGNLPEAVFWNAIKNGQFHGLDFDRQKQIGNYFADFYCAELNLVLELDGKSHDNTYEYDARRDEYMRGLGLTVVRISNVGVLKYLEMELQYLTEIITKIRRTTPSAS